MGKSGADVVVSSGVNGWTIRDILRRGISIGVGEILPHESESWFSSGVTGVVSGFSDLERFSCEIFEVCTISYLSSVLTLI